MKMDLAHWFESPSSFFEQVKILFVCRNGKIKPKKQQSQSVEADRKENVYVFNNKISWTESARWVVGIGQGGFANQD